MEDCENEEPSMVFECNGTVAAGLKKTSRINSIEIQMNGKSAEK
ncbi:hypothetical protein A2U01_0074597, partial [Trifolium medium]|nr:hypothetical protein [Trifolium medium]